MAYCPKCGVEVEDSVRTCPLCRFPVPDTGGSIIKEDGVAKYPDAANIYETYRSKIKNQLYFVVLILLVNAMVVLGIVHFLYPVRQRIVQYLFIVVLSLFMYAFFTYGFFGWMVNVTGIALTTLFLTYFIEQTGMSRWFMSYALPLVIIVYLNGVAFRYMYLHSKRRQRLSYIPVFVLMVASSLCLGVDAVVHYNLAGGIGFSWSLIVALSCMSAAFVVTAVLNYLPEKSKESIRRKLHM